MIETVRKSVLTWHPWRAREKLVLMNTITNDIVIALPRREKRMGVIRGFI
jgi:hypothetical protein